MYSVDGTTITMTRGDTVKIDIAITNSDGSSYTPVSTDQIVFSVKKDYTDTTVALTKNIPIDTMQLTIESEDTKEFEMPYIYRYDIQLIQDDGTVDTFIAKAKLKITEEVG